MEIHNVLLQLLMIKAEKKSFVKLQCDIHHTICKKMSILLRAESESAELCEKGALFKMRSRFVYFQAGIQLCSLSV